MLHQIVFSIDISALGGALGAVVALFLVGRLLVPREVPDIVALTAGWGFTVLAMTAVGTFFAAPLWPVEVGVAVLAAGSLAREIRARVLPEFWRSGLLALPLLIVVSGMHASQWDEFSHWLHAIRYLTEHGSLPGSGGREIHSCCAAYPYGWPFFVTLGNRLSGGFGESMPSLINVFLLSLTGGLFARILSGDVKAGWGAHALGVLLATVLCATFVPKLVFTAYADVATGVLVGTLGWIAWRMIEADDTCPRICLAFGLIGVALVGAKPANLLLFVFITGGLILATLRMRSRSLGGRDLMGLAVAVIPPLLAWLMWRVHVVDNLELRELSIRPFETWNLALVSDILVRMGLIASKKGAYFGIMVLFSGLGLLALFRPTTPLRRLAIVGGGIFLGYQGFLLFAYVAVFSEYDALRAASYWRYNTHLGWLASLFVAVAVRAIYDLRPGVRSWLPRVGWLPIGLILLAPIVLIEKVRFDLDSQKDFVRQAARNVKTLVPTDADIFIVDPLGSGLANVMARYEWQGTPRLSAVTDAFTPLTEAQMRKAAASADYILVLSINEAASKVFSLHRQPAGFLIKSEARLRFLPIERWPFPGGKVPDAYP